MARQCAIQLVKEVGVQKVISKFDSQNDVRKTNRRAKDLPSHGTIVKEVKGILQSFEDFSIAWARRSANKVAHMN